MDSEDNLPTHHHPIPEVVHVPIINTHKEPIQAIIDNGDWSQLTALVERDPDVCRQHVSILFQGQEIACLPLHAVVGRRRADLSIIVCLVTAFSVALMVKDAEGERLPLHMAVIKGISADVVRYMAQALPQSLQITDREGNLPLHYAAMYSSEEVVELLVNLSPDACQNANSRARLPLHLLCARIWDHGSLPLPMIRHTISHNPEAARLPERQGRLPLHLACEQGYARRDIVELLVDAFPAGLLYTDEFGRTPLAICEWMVSSGMRGNELVLTYLRYKASQEKPKTSLLDKILSFRG
jgi:hypothetical protein